MSPEYYIKDHPMPSRFKLLIALLTFLTLWALTIWLWILFEPAMPETSQEKISSFSKISLATSM